MINTIEDLQELVVAGETDWRKYGHVRSFEHEGMIGFDYLPEAEFEATWNAFERMSRGLVLCKETGRILARPYDKFFNLGQHNAYPTSKISYALEKADGSLGIFYRDNKGELRCNTRGSFTSDQAVKGLELAKEVGLDRAVGPCTTILAEIIYPENRIVVDYSGWEGLIFHGYIVHPGYHMEIDTLELALGREGILLHEKARVAQTYAITSQEACVEFANSMGGVEGEGVVIVTETNERFKIKGEDYLRLHRLVTDITPKRVWELLKAGDYNEYRKQIPDEFLEEFDSYAQDIQNQVGVWVDHTESLYESAPKSAKTETQKDYALWVLKQPAFYRPYLFALHGGKDISVMYLDNWKKLTGYVGA